MLCYSFSFYGDQHRRKWRVIMIINVCVPAPALFWTFWLLVGWRSLRPQDHQCSHRVFDVFSVWFWSSATVFVFASYTTNHTCTCLHHKWHANDWCSPQLSWSVIKTLQKHKNLSVISLFTQDHVLRKTSREINHRKANNYMKLNTTNFFQHDIKLQSIVSGWDMVFIEIFLCRSSLMNSDHQFELVIKTTSGFTLFRSCFFFLSYHNIVEKYNNIELNANTFDRFQVCIYEQKAIR